jgi:CheY-like chemotaxis protein
MAGSTVNPAVKPSTDNSSQLQRMKQLTKASVIHSLVKFQNINLFSPVVPDFFLLDSNKSITLDVLLVFDMKQDENISRVLIVNDDVSTMLLLQVQIKKCGNYEVFEARNGKEAIEQYLKIKPGYIFMDLNMPVMDGIEATKEIRLLEIDEQDKTRIFAISVSIPDEIRESCITAGMDEMMLFPFRLENVRKLLELNSF